MDAEGTDQPTVEAPAAEAPTQDAEQPTEKPDGSLGENGEKALRAEREARKTLEKQLADAKTAQQAQLDAIAKALGLKGEDEAADPAKITTELEESRKAAADNAAALIRYKTAVEKEVPSHLVEFVTGSTAEEVEASIEKVLGAFASAKPAGPRPDPSQGQQGVPASLDAQIRDAEQRGDTKEAIRLKARRLSTN